MRLVDKLKRRSTMRCVMRVFEDLSPRVNFPQKRQSGPSAKRLLIMVSLITPEIRKRGDVTVIAFGPQFESLDETVLDKVRDLVLDAAKNAEPAKVVIDLSHTKFFGSSFIEVLFRIWNRINGQAGGGFALAGLSSYCREVLEITHLDKLWKLHANEDDAVASLS